MKTILAYLKSKTVQGIIGLVVIGLLQKYKIDILPSDLLDTLEILFYGWTGLGLRNAVKKIETQ